MSIFLNLFSSLWILDIFYKICLIVDSIIYTVAGWLFNTFYAIAGMSIVNDFESLNNVIGRVELFVGIFALFVLVKSLFNSFVDPDKLASNSSSIVKNSIIAIVLLVSMPVIFDILNGFQSAVIGSDVIPKLVMDQEQADAAQNEDGSFLTMNNVGNVFMNNVFLLFFRYDNVTIYGYVLDAIKSFDPLKTVTDLGNAVFGTVDSAYNAVREGSPIISLLPYTNSSNIHYEYPVISGIVGLVFCYYFIKIAVSIGVRLFKLFTLQVIAPIPIVLSVDPSQSSVLKNFFNYLINTYADLFIRLFCVVMVYPIIITLTNGISSEKNNIIINLILIFALLKFAKEFPKILSEILGLNVKFSDKGPSGFLGGLFGAGVGLATGAVVSKNIGLKGKDFALHTVATGFKGGVGGHSGAQHGFTGFAKSMVGGTANSYVDATQIYSTGGYGNWLKAQMYEKTGQAKIFAQQREKLSDAVTNTKQHYDSLVQQQKSVFGLKTTARQLYDEATGGGIKNSFEYKQALEQKENAVKNNDVNAYNAANSKLQIMDMQYEREVADFYNNASSESLSPQAVTLASIKEQINKEISSVDSSFDLSSYDSIDNVATGFKPHIDVAELERDQAILDLKEFKKREDVQIANYKLENNNRYMAGNNGGNRSSQGSSGRTGTGQQGQGSSGRTGTGQQGQGPSSGTGTGQQGQGSSSRTGTGQQGQGSSSGTGTGQQGQGSSSGTDGGRNN